MAQNTFPYTVFLYDNDDCNPHVTKVNASSVDDAIEKAIRTITKEWWPEDWDSIDDATISHIREIFDELEILGVAKGHVQFIGTTLFKECTQEKSNV